MSATVMRMTPARGVEARGQGAHAAVLELRHREDWLFEPLIGDGRQLRVAGKQTALGIAHGVVNRIGRGQAAVCESAMRIEVRPGRP